MEGAGYQERWLLDQRSWREKAGLIFALEYHFSDELWSPVSSTINSEKYGIEPLRTAVPLIMLHLQWTHRISKKKQGM